MYSALEVREVGSSTSVESSKGYWAPKSFKGGGTGVGSHGGWKRDAGVERKGVPLPAM